MAGPRLSYMLLLLAIVLVNVGPQVYTGESITGLGVLCAILGVIAGFAELVIERRRPEGSTH
ncbi:hypothetical protein [Halomarina rubra]|uniref:Uncharacterized protein n=1 Tax=Halomarina rubra TaxID=2071873 RepID=A0ABD6AYX0_9EURY|nr:hypothetical protein [Halomarina rubra]